MIRNVPFVVVISSPLISTDMGLSSLALLVGTITAAATLHVNNGDTTAILDDANLKSKLLYFGCFFCLYCVYYYLFCLLVVFP